MFEAFAQAFGWVTGGAAGVFAIYVVIITTIMIIEVLDKLIQKG